jgi:methyl-accepting chemotaxis protein
LKENPIFIGTYTAWEPNAFDGKDTSFVSAKGHDNTGRFIPHFYRNKESIALDPIVGIDDESKSEWYHTPKKTKKEYITDPFYYEGVYMISFLSPVVIDNNFIGISGIDFSMDFMQTLVDGYNLYGGKSRLSVISETGNIVAISNNHEAAGKNINAYISAVDLNKLHENKTSTYLSNDTIATLVPFDLGTSNKNWYVLLETPQSVLMKDANVFSVWVFFICFIIFTVLIASIYYLVSKHTKPIDIISANAKEIAMGKNKHTHINNVTNEISVLHHTFNEMVDAQSKIADVCLKISEGDFSQKVDIRSDEDILSISVNKMIDNLIQASEEDKKRTWASEGLAKLNEILRNTSNLSAQSDNIISFLVNYVGANQAGFFIVNDGEQEQKHLELMACYAYSRKKYIHQKIEIGEGLVGQCFLEKEITYLTEIPDNYLKISSGIGEARPKNLVLIPLIYDEQVIGILETASFKKLEQHHVDFLNKACEIFASSIHNFRINERTKMLLELSQQQTEEMRAQEEEMRQNLEELMASQEEMKRKEESYIHEIERLKS